MKIIHTKVDTVKKKSAQYKQKWLNHVNRMENIKIAKQLLDYEFNGRKDLDNYREH
jgi:hypothetical protein